MSENLQQDFDLSTTAGKLADFYARRERSFAPSGEAAIEKQHARGKNTARERIEMLLDEGSFVEFDALARRLKAKSRNHAMSILLDSTEEVQPAKVDLNLPETLPQN